MTDRDMENRVIEAWITISIVALFVSVLILTLARVACAPAARLVPAQPSLHSPYNLAAQAAASEQAGELAAFYRNNF